MDPSCKTAVKYEGAADVILTALAVLILNELAEAGTVGG
jgi:hypothetical protein